ncbi:hypothetical protein [Arcticibacter sp. MXS-1]
MNPEETKPKADQESENPADDVETVVSNNDNIEPVPDKEQLEDKKKTQD